MSLRYILIVLSYIIVYSCSLSYSGDDSELAVSQTKATLSFLSNSIEDLNFYIFDNEGQLFYHEYISDPSITQTDAILFQRHQYTAYALANYHSSLFFTSASSLESFKFPIEAGTTLIDYPIMSGKYGPFVATQNTPIPLVMEHKYSKIKVSFDLSLMNGCSRFDVKSVAIRNTPKYITPFSDFKAQSIDDISPDGYSMTISGTNKDNTSDTTTLYTPENLQGNLLPNNTLQAGKILSDPYQASICTFIEIEAEYQSESRSGTLIYRLYPGLDDKSNFDIIHNTSYNITVQPIGDGLNDINWRIDTQDLESLITSITFTQTCYILDNKGDSITIIPIIFPEEASGNDILWSSQHPEIISVTQDGIIKGISRGTSYIYIESQDAAHIKNSVMAICDCSSATISSSYSNGKYIVTATNVMPSDYVLKVSSYTPSCFEYEYITDTQIELTVIKNDDVPSSGYVVLFCFIVPYDMDISSTERPLGNKYYVQQLFYKAK